MSKKRIEKKPKKKVANKKAVKVKPVESDAQLMECIIAFEKHSTIQKYARLYARRFEKVYGTTPIDMVTSNEIYIAVFLGKKGKISTIKRGYRICGMARTVDGKKSSKFRCLLPAGSGTNHKGIGVCRQHHNQIKGVISPLTILEGLADAGMAVDLSEALKRHPGLMADKVLSNLDEEIVISRFLISQALLNPNNIISREEVSTHLDVAKGLKLAKSKIETDRFLMTPKVLTLFVEGIDRVASDVLPPEYYQRFMLTLYERIKLPLSPISQKLLNESKVDDD